MINIGLKTFICRKEQDEVVKNLWGMVCFDYDFIGENGEEYLWEEVIGTEFESNCDYALHLALKQNNLKDVIRTFICEWQTHDSNYYTDYRLSIEETDTHIFVAFAYETEY